MRTKPTRPIPVPTPLTQPFWDAARDGKLAIQRCQSCDRYFHPPVGVCTRCQSIALGFVPVSGRGRIHSRTIMHDPRIRGFADSVPFVIIAVELDEQPGLLVMSNLLRVPPGDAVIGRRVEVEFEPIEGGFALPQFCLAGSESRPKIAP